MDLIRELLDPLDGAKSLTQREVAEKFEVSPGTIGDIGRCRRRAVLPTAYKRVRLPIRTPKIALDVTKG